MANNMLNTHSYRITRFFFVSVIVDPDCLLNITNVSNNRTRIYTLTGRLEKSTDRHRDVLKTMGCKVDYGKDMTGNVSPSNFVTYHERGAKVAT